MEELIFYLRVDWFDYEYLVEDELEEFGNVGKY